MLMLTVLQIDCAGDAGVPPCGYAAVEPCTSLHLRRLLAEDAAGAVHAYDAAAGRHADVPLPQLGSAAMAVAADSCRSSQQLGHDGSAVHSPRWRCWMLKQSRLSSADADMLSLLCRAFGLSAQVLRC